MWRISLVFIWLVTITCTGLAQGGHWRMVGGGVFTAGDQWEDNGWHGRVEGRSQNYIVANQTFRAGEVVKTVRMEWISPPAVLQPGDVPPLSARATILNLVNPGGWSLQTTISCFVKTPYRAFWEATIPFRQGGTIEVQNSDRRIAEGAPGSKMTIVFRMLGFGPAKDTEFTYEWASSALQSGGDHASAGNATALEGVWFINGRSASIRRGSGEPLIFTNEGGATSRGRFVDSSMVIAIDWTGGLRGSLQDGGNTIRWENGTVWTRAPGSAPAAASPSLPPPAPTHSSPPQALPALSGNWQINNRPVQVFQAAGGTLMFVNEGGSRSAGRFVDVNTVIATDWVGGLRGTLQDSGNTIRWANGTVWTRARP